MSEIDYADVISRIQDAFKTCSDDERSVLTTILEEISKVGYSQTYETLFLSDFKEVPVSIDRFLCDPEYLGNTNDNGKMVYPEWKRVMHEIFADRTKYYESIFQGATRIGKSSTMVSCMAYMTYLLMIYRDPHSFFNKKSVSKFTIAFANLTKDLAAGVAFHEYQTTLKSSEWFLKRGRFTNSINDYRYVPEGDRIDIIPASDASHVLGMQLWALAMDEVNFLKAGTKDINLGKTHMRSLYNTGNARITGTFRLRGKVYGKMFVCSSKNTDNDYLSDHVEEQLNAGNTHMYLFDKPQWEVLPSSMFSHERFYITVGDRYKRGFVVSKENEDEAHLEEYKDQGYRILEVPKDYETNFRADYDIALRDIAGISVVGAMGFITQESITPCVSQDRQNPFFQDVLVIGTHDNEAIENFFHLEVVPKEIKRIPMNIHIDFAEVSDHTGISGVGPDGTKVVLDRITEKKIVMPFYKQIFQVAIEAPPGDRMSFQKVINFILWLRRSGFHVNTVTTDQYQSAFVRESLEHLGFVTDKISVDKSEDPYIGLRNLLQDQRIELVKHDLQEQEMIHLQRLNGRIDHPAQGCFTGDTQLQLPDGRMLSILELMIECKYKTNWVYSFNESTQKIEPKRIKKVFQSKLVSDLVQITLDNGQVIKCTPDHLFMLRDGSYKEAKNLTSSESLMPLYTKIADKGPEGYRMYYEPMENCWHYEHRQFCEDAILNTSTHVIHHKNYNKLNNIPSNLQCMTRSAHQRLHNNNTHNYDKTSSSLRQWHSEIKGSSTYEARSSKISTSVRSYYRHKYSIEEFPVDIENQRIESINALFSVNYRSLTVGQKYIVTHMYNDDNIVAAIESHSLPTYSDYADYPDLQLYLIAYHAWKLKLRKSEPSCSTYIKTLLDIFDISLKKHSNEPKVNRIIDKQRVNNIIDQQERHSEIERLFNVKWEDISPGARNSLGQYYSRYLLGIYSITGQEYIEYNQRKLKHSNESSLEERIQAIETYFDISWNTLTKKEKSSYSERYWNLTHPKERYDKYRTIASVMHDMHWYTNGETNLYIKSSETVPEGFYLGRVMNRKNHKVVKVEFIHQPCKVYDLEVEDNHNFALAAGVFVHNSGPNKGIGKDCSDALCGAAWQCIETQDQVKPAGHTIASAISSVNSPMSRARNASVTSLNLSKQKFQQPDPRMPQVFAPGIRRL